MRFILLFFLTSIGLFLLIWFGTSPQWPLELILKIQSINNKTLVFLLQKITDSISLISIGIPVLILIYHELKKDKSKRKPVALILICLAFSGLASTTIKNSIKKIRPFEVDARIEKLSGGGSFSFPSGHTTEAVTAAIMMIFTFRHWYVIITYSCWALLIMYSRMALGVHDIVDLVGGAMVASGSVLVVLITQHRFFTKQD